MEADSLGAEVVAIGFAPGADLGDRDCVMALVGLQRAGLGNPWDVNTTSGNALADDSADVRVDDAVQVRCQAGESSGFVIRFERKRRRVP